MEKILVVDDSKLQLTYVSMLLTKEGYEVQNTEIPLAAKEMVEQQTFDLLLCDLKMPEIDGIALLEHAKSCNELMPVVIMTAFGDRKSAIQALAKGADDYIFKAKGDQEEEEFLIRIRRVLDKAKLQRRILRYQIHLEEMVDERTKALKETQDQLIQSEKLRSLGILTNGIAHDFNNILGVVVGRTQILLRKVKDPEIVADLKLIEKSALKGASTINRMQDYSRLRKDEVFEPVQLNDIIDEVTAITKTRWKDEANEKGIVINVEIKLDDISLINGNVSELEDVFINVIFNALDAMPKGGELKIKTYQKEILNDEWVVVAVSDTGHGIPEDIGSKVFDPFFTTKNDQGSGLGMSLAYNIINRHKGNITFESEVGKGTVFYVQFPAALFVQEVFPTEKKKVSQRKKKKKLSIMVIDDDDSIRSMLAEIFEVHGHSVDSADSGKTALRLFEKQSYEIVFTDLGMPEMSGWEVAQKIKKLAPATRIIMITGWGTQLDSQKAKESGIEKIIPKPVSYDELLSVLNE